MKKILAGAVIGITLSVSSAAFAATAAAPVVSSLVKVSALTFDSTGTLDKFVDTQNGATCYVATHGAFGSAPAISCLK